MISTRGLLPLLGIALAAAASWWLYHQVSLENARQDGSQRHDPDVFADDIDLRTLNAGGKLEHRLSAVRMEHYPDDDSTTLEAPRLELYRPGEPPWRIRARKGWVSSGGAEVLLEGDVNVQRDGAAGLRPAHLTTSKLRVFPDRDYAESDVAVTYRTTDLEVRSLGMRAHFDTGQVELPARVRAVHQPPPSRPGNR